MEPIQLGILSLLPILVLFTLIFKTKRMVLSLVVATLLGSILYAKLDFAQNWLAQIQNTFMAGTLGYLFLLLALFGVLIELLDKSGAAVEFANWISKFANTRRKALVLSYVLGWLIFVDDYLHIMALGGAMKGVCARHKISRSMLAYLTNASAATVCVMVPMSTWGVFYSGFFEKMNLAEEGKGLSLYLSSIPLLFYAIFLLVILLLVCLGVLPKLGLLKKEEKLAEQGILCSAESSINDRELRYEDVVTEGAADGKNNPIWFVLPMLIIIALTIITGDCMIGCMGSIAAIIIIILSRKILKLTEIFESSYTGVKNMFNVCLTISMALTFVEINKSIGMTDYVVSLLTPLLQSAPWTFPAIVFAFLGMYSFFAGGAWNGSMIFMPIIVPVAAAIGINPALTGAACVSASCLSSTIYIGGDAMLLTSAALEMKPIAVMNSIFPYALASYILSIISFLIAGLVL